MPNNFAELFDLACASLAGGGASGVSSEALHDAELRVVQQLESGNGEGEAVRQQPALAKGDLFRILGFAFSCPEGSLRELFLAVLSAVRRCAFLSHSAPIGCVTNTQPLRTEAEQHGKDGDAPLAAATDATTWKALPPTAVLAVVRLCVEAESTAIVRSHFTSQFCALGEIPNYYRVYALFPEVLRRHHDAMHFMLCGDGPLAFPDRLGIALVACSQHRNEYLVRRFAALLVSRYDSVASEWLGKQLPPKLEKLRKFAALAAHQPWTISGSSVRELIEGGHYTVAELLHASCIIASCHGLCGIVAAFAINHDPQTCIAPLPHGPLSQDIMCQMGLLPDIHWEHRGKSQATTLRPSVFNWSEHGSALMQSLYEGAAERINAEHDTLKNLSHETDIGAISLDRATYDSRCCWHLARTYVRNIVGPVKDDFEHAIVNKVFKLRDKAFLQKVAIRPDELTQEEYVSFFASPDDSPAPPVDAPPEDSTDSQDAAAHVALGAAQISVRTRALLVLYVAENRRLAELVMLVYAISTYLREM